jgi:rubrerythrin
MDKVELGKNRTGVQMSPKDARKMLEPAEGAVLTQGDAGAAERLRAQYIRESGPIGSVPMPGTASGTVKAGVKALSGKRMPALVDRLGERLAFERSGTRLYEAMVVKARASGTEGERLVGRLEEICAEEAEHFRMLDECLTSLGCDPTAQTPAADIAGVESVGLMQVVTDPSTSMAQSIHAILVAELVDNDAWDGLIDLARELGQDELVERFEIARDEEREHLESVREWHRQVTRADARLLS